MFPFPWQVPMSLRKMIGRSFATEDAHDKIRAAVVDLFEVLELESEADIDEARKQSEGLGLVKPRSVPQTETSARKPSCSLEKLPHKNEMYSDIQQEESRFRIRLAPTSSLLICLLTPSQAAETLSGAVLATAKEMETAPPGKADFFDALQSKMRSIPELAGKFDFKAGTSEYEAAARRCVTDKKRGRIDSRATVREVSRCLRATHVCESCSRQASQRRAAHPAT